jgi:hypothetical protein
MPAPLAVLFAPPIARQIFNGRTSGRYPRIGPEVSPDQLSSAN